MPTTFKRKIDARKNRHTSLCVLETESIHILTTIENRRNPWAEVLGFYYPHTMLELRPETINRVKNFGNHLEINFSPDIPLHCNSSYPARQNMLNSLKPDANSPINSKQPEPAAKHSGLLFPPPRTKRLAKTQTSPSKNCFFEERPFTKDMSDFEICAKFKYKLRFSLAWRKYLCKRFIAFSMQKPNSALLARR